MLMSPAGALYNTSDKQNREGAGEILLLETNFRLSLSQLISLEFQSAEDALESGEVFDPPYPAVNILIEMFDYLAVGFFTLEYIVRFLCCPRKCKFFFG